VELRGVVWAIWGAAAAATLSVTGADPDLWGHLRFGLDWWDSFSLPASDPYSFTQDKPWVNHEWLSEAAMGAAYLAGGVSGLILLKVAVIAATLAILSVRLRGATPLMRTVILGLAIVCVLPISLTVRPQIWSVVCLAALCALLDRSGPPNAGRVAACAVLFVLWANLHGGWITGAAVLIAYGGIRVVRSPSGLWSWSAMIAAPLAATLVNPYGAGLWRFLAGTVRSSRPDISEWQPMGVDSPLILWIPVAGSAIVAALLSRNARTRPSPAVWAVLILLVVAALRVHRVAPLMGPASLVLLAPGIVRAWGSVGRIRLPNRQAAYVLWIPVVVAWLAIARQAGDSLTCLTIRSGWAPDLAVARALTGSSGTLVTTFDWGEYAIWHFGPDLRVSIDGRRETVYSDRVVELHRRFERAEPAAMKEIGRLSPDYVWLPAARTSVRDWLAANGYRIDVGSAESFVAVRDGLPRLDAPTGDAPSRCFP
jgi:hypothetical protein